MKQEMMAWQYSISRTICKSFATRYRHYNHARTSSLIFTGPMLFLMPNQQCQSTEGNLSLSYSSRVYFLANSHCLFWL